MTHEEKKAAVLAECERLCPVPESEWDNGLFRITAWQSKWPKTWELYAKSRSNEWMPIATVEPSNSYRSPYYDRSLDLFSFVLGLDKPPATIDLSPIKPHFEVLEKYFSLQSNGYAHNWYMLSAYLVGLESGTPPPADTKWERLKEMVKQTKENDVHVITERVMTSIEALMERIEKGEL